MSRPIEATPPLSAEDSEALAEQVNSGCGRAEMNRRAKAARQFLEMAQQPKGAGAKITIEDVRALAEADMEMLDAEVARCVAERRKLPVKELRARIARTIGNTVRNGKQAAIAALAELCERAGRAKRFKGWRVVISYDPEFYGEAKPDCRLDITTLGRASRDKRYFSSKCDVRAARIVRVYRTATTPANRKETSR